MCRVVGCQAHARDEPVGQKQEKNRNYTKIHIITSVIESVIPVKRYVGSFPRVRVVRVIQS